MNTHIAAWSKWLALHVFVIATGFAALLHSTWAIATIFNSYEPARLSLDWLWWVIPGFAFAFAIDVGQIATSAELRNGERTRWKYATFVALAICTYYLQWWYLAHHIPHVPLADGVRQEWVGAASWGSDAALWIAPALLPLSTTLYTFGYAKLPRKTPTRFEQRLAQASALRVEQPEQTALPKVSEQAKLPAPEMEAMFLAKCEDCGKEWPCETERQVTNKLNAHRRFCSAVAEPNRRR